MPVMGFTKSVHAFERLEEEIELRPILESLAARPPLDAALADDTQARLRLLFGGISVALARTFKLIDAELKAVHTEEWERTFSLFRADLSRTGQDYQDGGCIRRRSREA